MQSRVSAALVRHIEPMDLKQNQKKILELGSSKDESLNSIQNQEVIQDDEKSQEEDLLGKNHEESQNVGLTFLALFQSFRNKKNLFFKRSALRDYRSTLQVGRKNSKIRKGIVLDLG